MKTTLKLGIVASALTLGGCAAELRGVSINPDEAIITWSDSNICKVERIEPANNRRCGSIRWKKRRDICLRRSLTTTSFRSEPISVPYFIYFSPDPDKRLVSSAGRVEVKITPQSPDAKYKYTIVRDDPSCDVKDKEDVNDPHIRVERRSQ